MSTLYVAPESLFENKTFRRLIAFSLIGHVALYVGLVFHPFSSRAVLISPSPVMVSVVEMPKSAPPAAVKKAAPKPPAPKPAEVKPPPPPPKPVVNEIVIPKEPAPLAKPKPVVKPVAKPEPKPKSAEELIAELTKKVEAENPEPEPIVQAAVTPGPAVPMAGGPGVFDPLMSPWVAKVRTVLNGNWTGAQICKGTAVFSVNIESNGQLSDIELAESSGDRYCDESAERAIRKSNPLPAPPHGAMSAVQLDMNPKDVQ